MMLQELIALKSFSHGVGTVENGALFKAPPTYAKSLVEAGIARLASIDPGAKGSRAGYTAVILGSGPSLTLEDVLAVKRWRETGENRLVAVTNLTFRAVPWADLLYAADDTWWDEFHDEVKKDFHGEAWSQSEHARRNYGTNFIQCEKRPGLSSIEGVIHSGGNSGYQLIGLLVAQGVRKIVLLGFDMQATGGRLQHHLPYPKGFHEVSPFENWISSFNTLAPELKARRVRVLNSSRVSALDCFERRPLVEALKDEQPEVEPMQAHSMIRAGLHYRREIFNSGLEAVGCRVHEGAPKAFNEDTLLLIWNRYGVNHALACKAEAAGGKVIVAENGYLAAGGGTPKFDGGWYALALGGHNGIGKWKVGGSERWDALGVELKPWRTHGDHILVCPNRSFGQPGNIMPHEWPEQVSAALRENTDRPIRIRPHPRNEEPKVPLSEDLKDAWAVVIWSSSAGVHALIEGIPVFQCAPKWVCSPCAYGDLSNIESPLLDDELRDAAMGDLSWAQWNANEIASGEAFRCLLT